MSITDSRTGPLRWFGRSRERLDADERRILDSAEKHIAISEDVNDQVDARATFGDRLADKIAAIGGSWAFILGFLGFLLAWAIVNTLLLGQEAFDPYPFIFLNLVLSMIAAIQAPIIMMSQNRSAARDRLDASHDYAVNLKSEIEIMALHAKMDALREAEIALLAAKLDAIITRLERIEPPALEGRA